MSSRYRKNVRYAYLITYAFNPYPMAPGTSKIASAFGTVTLTDNKTAHEMMDLIFSYVKENADLHESTTIFPSLYHVEED